MTIAAVQKATATGVNATSITTPAFASATTAGNVLIGACSSSRSAATNTFVFSDSKANTWTTDASANNFHSGGNSSCCAVGSTTLATAGSSHTVSCTAGSGANGYQLVAEEFSGLTTTVDQTATATAGNSTTSITATTAATTNANNLLVGCYSGDTNTTSTGVGTPTVNASSTGVVVLETVSATAVIAIQASYLILAATGAQAVKWAYSSDASGQYSAAVVAYQGASGGSDVSVNLTGQTATFSEGSIAEAIDYAASGQTATFTEGALSDALSYGLTGQTGTFSAGTLARAVSYGLTGETATFTEGTISASTGGNVTLTLSGQTASFSEGSIPSAVSYAAVGRTSTFTEGTLGPSTTYGLTARSATFTEGSMSRALGLGLSGQTATFSEGVITVTAPGNVTRTLTGLSASFTLGVISAATSGTGPVMPNLIGLNYYMALQMLQEAGIYVPLVVYAFEPSSISVQWQKTTGPGGIVKAQSIAAGLSTAPGQPITLSVSTFPFSSVIDSPPDWNQL